MTQQPPPDIPFPAAPYQQPKEALTEKVSQSLGAEVDEFLDKHPHAAAIADKLVRHAMLAVEELMAHGIIEGPGGDRPAHP